MNTPTTDTTLSAVITRWVYTKRLVISQATELAKHIRSRSQDVETQCGQRIACQVYYTPSRFVKVAPAGTCCLSVWISGSAVVVSPHYDRAAMDVREKGSWPGPLSGWESLVGSVPDTQRSKIDELILAELLAEPPAQTELGFSVDSDYDTAVGEDD